MTNCGPEGSGTESCCTSLEVKGGTYYRTYSSDEDGGATGEADPADVSSFRLDKYDVTVGRFRQFVSAVLPPDGGAGWVPAPGSGRHVNLNGGAGLVNSGEPGTYERGWVAGDDVNVTPTNGNLACMSPYRTWTNTAGTQETLPINCVNWYEAYAFCIWDGGFLPSEAELGYAAAGGNQQRAYPWGSTAPGDGYEREVYSCYFPAGDIGDAGRCQGVANVAPVGTATLGAARWGQLDMAGEVWEWVLDGYDPYAACSDCADVAQMVDRVIRGSGSFYSEALVPALRLFGSPTIRDDDVGFRCARTP